MHLVALYVVHLAKVATVVLGDAVEKVIRFQKILYASMIVKELTEKELILLPPTGRCS